MRMEKVRISGMFGQAAWDLVLQIADSQSRGPEYCLKVVPIEQKSGKSNNIQKSGNTGISGNTGKSGNTYEISQNIDDNKKY